jgi:hypothetical protein
MGMDVYGKKPTSERGEYFRANVYGWGALTCYFLALAPDICAPCKGWHYNDGDGLDSAGAVALADALWAEIDAGRMASYAARTDPALPQFDEPPRRKNALTPLLRESRNSPLFLRDSGGFEIWRDEGKAGLKNR